MDLNAARPRVGPFGFYDDRREVLDHSCGALFGLRSSVMAKPKSGQRRVDHGGPRNPAESEQTSAVDTHGVLVSKPPFYATEIDGRQFEGILSCDGPYISCGFDGVALGRCTTIELLCPEFDGGVGRHRVLSCWWWTTKYHTQPRVSLAAIRDEERQQLAVKFGIRMHDTRWVAEPFWDSPAFRSLATWVLKNPRAAARFRRYDAYLPGWHEVALAGTSPASPDGAR
jgi:hypothetical protein